MVGMSLTCMKGEHWSFKLKLRPPMWIELSSWVHTILRASSQKVSPIYASWVTHTFVIVVPVIASEIENLNKFKNNSHQKLDTCIKIDKELNQFAYIIDCS